MKQILKTLLAQITTPALAVVVLCSGIVASVSLSTEASAAVTTPSTINYQGRLLNSSDVPLSGNYTFRFSIWNTSDWVSSDTTGAGAINTGSAGYASWQEVQNVTADVYGLFNIDLGSITPFPSFNANSHKYLQVEVKTAGSPDTSYEILDPQGSLSDTTDRKTIENQSYAQNADTIDNADIGTSAGDLAVLGAGGVWDIARIPGGTNADSFVIDYDNSGSVASIQLGNDGTNGVINFSNATGDITFATPGDDQFIFDNGNLTATSDAGFDFSNADLFRVRENANPNTSAGCSYIDELIMNTTSHQLMRCTATGIAGVATWANLATGGASDFEGTYSNDADKTLTTSNGNMTVNAGTGNFVVSASNISVNSAGNLTTAGTINGVNLSNIPFGNMAARVKTMTFAPDFQGASVDKLGGNNKGTLSLGAEDLGGSAKRNFYEWKTEQVSMQDIDVILSIQLPMDFVSFTASPLNIIYKTGNGITANNKVDLTMFDTTGAAITLSGASNLANPAWTNASVTFGGSPTFIAGQTITIHIKLSATNVGSARISDLILNYNGR